MKKVGLEATDDDLEEKEKRLDEYEQKEYGVQHVMLTTISPCLTTLINVRNWLTTTRWQVTPQIILTWTTPLITFHEPCYVNMIKLFSHGCRPRKAPSHQMDQTYLNTLEDA